MHNYPFLNRQLSETDIRILATARKMFLKDGIMQTDMKALAKELGCSRSTLYRHFPSKGDILVILAEKALQTIVRSTYIPDGLRFSTGMDAFQWQLNSLTECLIRNPDDLTFLREFDCFYYKEFSMTTETYSFEAHVSSSAQTSPLLETFRRGLADNSIQSSEKPELVTITIIHSLIALAQRVMPAEQNFLHNFGYGQELLRQAAKMYINALSDPTKK